MSGRSDCNLKVSGHDVHGISPRPTFVSPPPHSTFSFPLKQSYITLLIAPRICGPRHSLLIVQSVYERRSQGEHTPFLDSSSHFPNLVASQFASVNTFRGLAALVARCSGILRLQFPNDGRGNILALHRKGFAAPAHHELKEAYSTPRGHSATI